MEGRGVTNYDVSKPNFNITTSTTEFDDELMRRNIVSFEQCMIGKGATPQEARRLAIQKKEDNYIEDVGYSIHHTYQYPKIGGYLLRYAIRDLLLSFADYAHP